MKAKLFIILAFGISLFFTCEDAKVDHLILRQPTETIVRDNGEENANNALNRQLWIEQMHMTAPGQNWRKIEYENAKAKIKTQTVNRRNEQVILGDSLYTGYWSERGSKNQAGSINKVNYHRESDMIYCISAGGTIWKGPRDGTGWEVVNESFMFDVDALELLENEDGSTRMIATIARIPHYSDDFGATWNISTGINSSGDFWSKTTNFETVELNDNTTRIYCLSKFDFSTDISLYYSDDLGESYELIETFNVDNFDDITINNPHGSNDILVAFRAVSGSMQLEKIDHETASLTFLDLTDISIDRRLILVGNYTGQEDVLYALHSDNFIWRSIDEGKSWEQIAPISTFPWDIGFYNPPSNPEELFFGNIEAYRLSNNSFAKVNNWWDYYVDVEFSLHADMMTYQEFVDPDGLPFILIGNHGGLSISYDYLRTNQNIGLEGLNVSQYYDVRTDPLNPNFVYAGTQDQGFQRTNNASESEEFLDFDQVISGDYGHITFSGGGEGMWMVFPGGSVDFYPNPQTGFSQGLYTLDSSDESSWLPPLAEIPGSDEHEILMAGGNVNGGFGSHLIKLKALQNGVIEAEQFPFNFKANAGGGNGGIIAAIEVSELNPNIIYVTVSNGDVFVSLDGGETFDSGYNSINNGHFLYGASIYASKINENEVWIAGSGYNFDGVFYSDDYGKNFTLFSEGLPATLVFEITANADETQFYAATEIGPYVYLSETQKWEDLSQGNTPVHIYWSVEYLADQDLVRFGTYGRGIWDFKFGERVEVSTSDLEQFDFATIYPNPVEEVLNIQFDLNVLNSGAIMELIDMQGRVIYHSALQTSIDMHQFSAGIYTLRIRDEKKVQIEQVIKL